MIQIRNSYFETNSSSANILIVPKEQSCSVPDRFIYVEDETSLKPSEKVIYSILNSCYSSSSEDIDKIVNFLYLNGVNEIIYGGNNPCFKDAIEKYKDNPMDMGLPDGWSRDLLFKALFGFESTVEHYEDGDHRPTYKSYDDDDENYYVSYSADW